VAETVDAVFSLSISADMAVVFQESMAGLPVVAWIVARLAIGYLRFRQANIS